MWITLSSPCLGPWSCSRLWRRRPGACGAHRRMCSVGQNRMYTPYMTVHLVISLPKILYIHRICIGLARTIYIRQGWVIRHRRIVRRIVFITYLTVFFKLLRIIRFWAQRILQPQAPQSPPEALSGPLEPPRGTSKPSRAPPEELPAPQNVA